MTHRSAACAALAALALPIVLAVACARPAPPAGDPGERGLLSPCRPPGVKEEVLCGTVRVWEDRQGRRGRQIDLRVVVLPALGPDPAPDPIFFFAGGPGGAATRRAGHYARRRDLRRRRDIVLVDQRGTGSSNPLVCDLEVEADAGSGRLPEMFPAEKVQACREELSQRADLTLYTSPVAVDDIDEVRRRLGYGKINLIGGSYGSRTVQLYMQRHPETVRAAAIRAVMPLDRSPLQDQAPNAQETLDRLLTACRDDPACGTAFPDLARRLRRLLGELETPRRLEITDPRSGEPRPFILSRELLAEGLRTLLYDLWTARALPYALHRAAGGDLEPMAQLMLLDEVGWGGLATGMLLTVYCSEDLPSFDVEEAVRRAEATVFGSYRIRQQIQACAHWPRGPVPEGYGEPLRSAVPTLLVSGELDPVNPARYGERVARGLPNGVHLVIPQGHHGLGGVTHPECALRLAAELLDRGTAAGLDTSCLDEMERLPFISDRKGFDALVEEWVDWL